MSSKLDKPVQRRIALIGPGSIGCCVAAALLSRGHELLFAARTPFERLRLDTPTGALDFAAHCVSDAQALGRIDLAVLTTKAHQTVSVKHWLVAFAERQIPIFVVQNGVDQIERTRQILADSEFEPLPKLLLRWCIARRIGGDPDMRCSRVRQH